MFCSRSCGELYRRGPRSCRMCGGPIPHTVKSRRTCSDACQDSADQAARAAKVYRARRLRVLAKRAAGFERRDCAYCGEGFRVRLHGPGLRRKYCGHRCSRLGGWKAACHKRRARIAGAEKIDRVAPSVVFNRDGWACQSCGCKVTRRGKRLHDRKATIDHITPLSRGGDHTYANVQTMCWKCNHQKRAAPNGDQMRLDLDVATRG